MLSAELTALDRGQTFKRHVRAAAAMQELYDDVSIADAVGVSRAAVAAWWRGAQPSPATIRRIADATGLPVDDLMAFVHYDGPPPVLPFPLEDEAEAATDRTNETLRGPRPRPLHTGP
jgi:transcriptional regulator with XRE-family HTH domain